MHRYPLDKLKNWLISDNRKPLILRGARQVGKTWLVRELARVSNKNLCELNFEHQRDLAKHFESNDPNTILKNLEATLGKNIPPDQSILFLDEIQAAPELLAKLRWFYEILPSLPVITAGSLLEFELEEHSFSMPVGRVSYFFVEPLGFEEFLLAKGESLLLERIQKITLSNLDTQINANLHAKACKLFHEYILVGGMPEAVSTWVKAESLDQLSNSQHDLINTYQNDFAKYAGRLSINYLQDALNAVPRFLGQKLIYTRINPAVRQASMKKAVTLLTKSRLCHSVQNVHGNGIPLSAEIDPKTFKLILLDTGLVSALLNLPLYHIKDLSALMLVNQGGLTEQVTGQLLRLLFPHYLSPNLYYWARQNPGASAEVDYLIQLGQQLIPIEVKSGTEGKMRSLHQLMSEKSWPLAVRIYAGPLTTHRVTTRVQTGNAVTYDLLSIPFYLIEQLGRLCLSII